MIYSSTMLLFSTKIFLIEYTLIEYPWISYYLLYSGRITQAPSLDCILDLCYSIKAWLDIGNENIAIIHCANGKSRSGILIACFLKYIRAFDFTADAFHFFCTTRDKRDITSNRDMLSTHYSILFENMDKVVENDGYPNRFPMHLKYIAVSGLPVDETPMIEVCVGRREGGKECVEESECSVCIFCLCLYCVWVYEGASIFVLMNTFMISIFLWIYLSIYVYTYNY